MSAAVSWRQETGQWDDDDMLLLRHERALIDPDEFAKVIEANVHPDLVQEFAAAIDATGPL